MHAPQLKDREQSMILLMIIASTIHVVYYQFRKTEFSNSYFLTAPAFLSFVFLIPVYISSDTYSYSFASYFGYLLAASATSGAITYSHHRRMDVGDLYVEIKTKAPIDLKIVSIFILGISILSVCAYFFENNSYPCTRKCTNSPYIFWVEQRFFKQYFMLVVSVLVNQAIFFRALVYAFRNRVRIPATVDQPNANEGA